MIRQTFERELQRLQTEMLALGSMVEKALLESVECLKRRDLECASRLIADDREINAKRYAIEADCLTLIATQQPMAGDLRTIAAILEITTELERTGDYAKGISRVNLYLGDAPLIKPLIDIPAMAQRARAMLHEARPASAAASPSLTLAEVDATFARIAATAGPGSAGGKARLLSALLARATADEQDFLVRLLAGELRQGAQVRDQRVVAEGDASLGEHYSRRARPAQFFHHMAHIPRRHELPLLDVYRLARARRGDQQIGLTAQEGGNLQQVYHLGGAFCLPWLVNIGGHRHAHFPFDRCQHAQPFLDARSAKGVQGGTVRFVERGFENVSDAQTLAGGFHLAGDLQAKRFAFYHTGPGDQRQPARADSVVSHMYRGDGLFVHGYMIPRQEQCH